MRYDLNNLNISIMRQILLALAALCIGVGASAQNYIEVNGYAERMITPDKFTISVVITERDNRGKNSLQEQERDIREALNRVGIDAKNNLKLVDNYATYASRKSALATRKYEVVVDGAEQLDNVMTAFGELNPYSYSIEKATCTKTEEIRSELRREAMKDAQKSATELTAAIDQTIGSCIFICDYSSESGDVDFYTGNHAIRGYSRKAESVEAAVVQIYDAQAAEPDPIEFSSQKLTHSVRVRFMLNE